MPFPESDRVIYKKNPLEQVLCQLRFPSILKIDTELPSAFQEKIRKEYPLFRDRPEGSVEIPLEIQQQFPAGLVGSFFGGNKAYEFVTSDEQWTVRLTRDFIALTTKKYQRWEQFRAKLEVCLDAFIEVYEPAFFSRIGLRYQNLIRKKRLGLENTQWSDLLRSYIAGELAAPEPQIQESIVGTYHNVLLSLKDENHQAKIVHGLVQDNKTLEKCYLIDNDFFVEQNTEINHALDILTSFNRENGYLFRWCITNQLHNAMEPNNI